MCVSLVHLSCLMPIKKEFDFASTPLHIANLFSCWSGGDYPKRGSEPKETPMQRFGGRKKKWNDFPPRNWKSLLCKFCSLVIGTLDIYLIIRFYYVLWLRNVFIFLTKLVKWGHKNLLNFISVCMKIFFQSIWRIENLYFICNSYINLYNKENYLKLQFKSSFFFA